MKIILQTNKLSKSQKDINIIKNIDLIVEQGKIHGLIGTDNSRKSLLVKMLCGLVKPTSGYVQLFGGGIKENLYRTGILTDEIGFYEELTAYENILMHLKYYKKLEPPLMDQIIEASFGDFNITSEMHRPVKHFSLGMKQILKLIRVFIIEPELMILYEPIQYVDPYVANILKEKLKMQKKKGTAIFIATAMLEFINDIADEICIMNYGEITNEIHKGEIMENKKAYYKIKVDNVPKMLFLLESKLAIFDYDVIDEQTLHILENFEPSYEILKLLATNGIRVYEAKYESIDIESYYLDRIGDQ